VAEGVDHLAALFGAMAHPVRVGVLLHLDHHGPCDVSCLSGDLGVEQSALSHQLARLRREGLVAVEQEGRRRVYRLADAHVAAIVRQAADHLGCTVE
jgi:DNA-binding transcriptional ArsR family regulator